MVDIVERCPTLDDNYDAFPRREHEFTAVLDESLEPRGPEFLYTVVEELGLVPGAVVLDAGCGEGRQAVELARRFGFFVIGVDPVPRQLELADKSKHDAVGIDAALIERVVFRRGRFEQLPVESASIDLVWCREALMYATDLGAVFSEFARVLRPGGRGVLYQMFSGPGMTDAEAHHFWTEIGATAVASRPGVVAKALAQSGLAIDRWIDLSSELAEHAQEADPSVGRRLLHAARLLRDPQRYIDRFGDLNYRVMLGECLAHVYRLIGKLSGQVIVLSKPEIRVVP